MSLYQNSMSHQAQPTHKPAALRIAVIPAAGKGTRAYPRTTFIPKPLLAVENTSLLAHNIEMLYQKFHIEKVYVIVGHLKEQIIDEVNSLLKQSPPYQIQTVPWTTRGLAADIASLESLIHEPFVLTLGDEFYQDTDHEKFLATYEKHPDLVASVGVIQNATHNQIKKNYSVELTEQDRIQELIEKPLRPHNQLLGVGSYLCTPEYFQYFKKTPPSKRTGIIEFTDVLDQMAKSTRKVFATLLNGRYFQVNSLQDYHHGIYEYRNRHFKKYQVSVIVPATQTSPALPDILQDHRNTGYSVAVEHFLSPQSDEFEGQVARNGLDKNPADILILTSGTGEFRAKDIPKLLEYIKDSDMVIGTRTTRQMIEQAANMRPVLRVIHLILGKMIEIFWWSEEPRITDADCQFFAIWKDAYLKIRPQLKVKGKGYIAEMHMEILRSHMRCIEIPVSFYKSDSVKAYSILDCFKEGWVIFKLILQKKFRPTGET